MFFLLATLAIPSSSSEDYRRQIEFSIDTEDHHQVLLHGSEGLDLGFISSSSIRGYLRFDAVSTQP
jgi:hypothetical protein